MSQSYSVLALHEAVAPITHMARSAGNESIVAREPVMTPRGVAWVPHLSGNAIRHRLVREPGVRFLIESYGLAGKLSLRALNYLFHGGNLTEGGGREDTSQIVAMQRTFPLLRLLGGALPWQIVSGSLLCGRGVLVCRENAPAIEGLLPPGWTMPQGSLRAAEDFVSGYQYTRGDAARSEIDMLAPGENGEEKSNLGIFAGQAVMRGACFVSQFTIQHASPLELGALLHSVGLWQAQGGTIGGQGSKGHGSLRTSLHGGEGASEAIASYLEHVVSSREAAVAWLEGIFAPKPPKPAKGAK